MHRELGTGNMLRGWALRIGTVGVVLSSAEGCDSTQREPPSLQTCAQGWWIDAASSPCNLACKQSQPSPECAQSDCVEQGYLGLTASGVAFDGIVAYSPSAKTMSSVAGVTKSPYTISGDTVKLSARPQRVTCTSSELTLDHGRLVRAPSDLALALDRATADSAGSWRGAPVK